MFASAPYWAVFGFLDDLGFWGQILWWVWLFYLAWYFYNWAQEHLAFSPLLTMIVAGILIYYMVIQYPLAGSFVAIMSLMIFSGLLWILPWLIPFVPGLNKLGKK